MVFNITSLYRSVAATKMAITAKKSSAPQDIKGYHNNNITLIVKHYCFFEIY